MPISDSYIVQYLLQETRDSNANIVWRENGSDGYTTCIHGMKIELESIYNRTGSRLCLTISCVQDRICISEPLNIGLFREKYRTDEERHLAELMNKLVCSVEHQCEERRKKFVAGADDIRQTVYRRLIDAVPTDN